MDTGIFPTHATPQPKHAHVCGMLFHLKNRLRSLQNNHSQGMRSVYLTLCYGEACGHRKVPPPHHRKKYENNNLKKVGN